MTTKHCFHCGLEIPDNFNLTVTFNNQEHGVCCSGCHAVAQGIIDSGLGRYYEQRTADANKTELPPQEILDQLKLYDLDDIQTSFVEIKPDNKREAVLLLSGITCAACVWLIEQRLLRHNGVSNVEINYGTQKVRITWDNQKTQLSDILLLIRQTGYDACPYDAMQSEQNMQSERKRSLVRLWVAGLSMMQVMMYAVPTYLFGDIEEQFLWLLHWASMMLTLPVVLYSAVPFYKGALRDLKNMRVGMDTPIALAILLAFIASTIALVKHQINGVFFDSISMFVFLLLGGRFLEQTARHKASDATERLMRLVPSFCHKLSQYPNTQVVEEAAVAQINPDDILLIKTGEVVPADGIVLSGKSEINESMLTGENMPVLKQKQDKVIAGTLNVSSPLIVKVSETGGNTRLASIVRLLDSAMSSKPRFVHLTDKVASVFVLLLLLVAAIVFAIWTFKTNSTDALWITVSLLVITCPCALSLATPTALTAAMGNLTRNGILITNGSAIERLPQITDIIFDKTGTLTEGNLEVVKTILSGSLKENEIAPIVYAMETQSEHPIASAILKKYAEYTDQQISLQSINNDIGKGMNAQINGDTFRIGKISYVAEIAGKVPDEINNLADGTIIALGNSQGFQAAFVLEDKLKSDAQNALSKLKNMNLSLHLLSGDNLQSVDKIAKSLGISNIKAEVTPEDKLLYVENLQKQNHKVLMIGDGVNDAPVLARADVSVAMSSGADVSRNCSDMVMMNSHLQTIPHTIQTAHKTHNIIVQNLSWAFLYNLIAIPIAATGYAKPSVAALGMAISSLLVVGNALRLLKSK